MTHDQKLENPNILDEFYARENSDINRIAVVECGSEKDNKYSWQDISTSVRRVASYIESLRLDKASNIIIYGANEASWLVADIAIMMTGHVSVPVYPNITSENLESIIEDCEAKLVFLGNVVEDKFIDSPDYKIPTVALKKRMKPISKEVSWNSIQEHFEKFSKSPRRESSDLATIIYTSGTTSKPKGVMHSFGAMSFVAKKVMEFGNITSSDRLYSFGTLAHVSERLIIETVGIHGGSEIYISESKEHFLRDLVKASPTALFANPLTWRQLKHFINMSFKATVSEIKTNPENKEELQFELKKTLGLSAIRHAFVGASPIEKETLSWFNDVLGLFIAEGYGMSETLGLITVNEDSVERFGSVGKAFDFCELKLSEEGEVLAKHDALTMGYYKNDKKTKELFTEDGFLRTGDVGHFDDEYLYITGRIETPSKPVNQIGSTQLN